MRKDLLISIVFLAFGILLAFLLPFHGTAGGAPVSSEITSHIVWALSLGQTVLYIIASTLVFQAVFRIKQLGGIIGTSLKILSIGLIFFGISQGQIAVLDEFNLWTSWYVNSGAYFLTYIIPLALMLFGLFVATNKYSKTSKITLILITVIYIALILLLMSLHHPANVYLGRTIDQFNIAILVNSLLVCIPLGLFLFSLQLIKAFSNSIIGRTYIYLSISCLLVLLTGISALYFEIISGWPDWYLTSGAAYLPYILISFSFVLFGFRLKYIRI